MANFIIAPTLTMGMKAPYTGILIATTWPLGNALGKIENNANSDTNTVYFVKSEEHDKANLNKIYAALAAISKVIIEEVSL